jgi:hypothetical protein
MILLEKIMYLFSFLFGGFKNFEKYSDIDRIYSKVNEIEKLLKNKKIKFFCEREVFTDYIKENIVLGISFEKLERLMKKKLRVLNTNKSILEKFNDSNLRMFLNHAVKNADAEYKMANFDFKKVSQSYHDSNEQINAFVWGLQYIINALKKLSIGEVKENLETLNKEFEIIINNPNGIVLTRIEDEGFSSSKEYTTILF